MGNARARGTYIERRQMALQRRGSGSSVQSAAHILERYRLTERIAGMRRRLTAVKDHVNKTRG